MDSQEMKTSKMYEVALEVAGPIALFNRPDAGSTPISYPVPTWSACKALFESVARMKGAYVNPNKVAICAPIRFEHYATNYGGPLRKNSQINNDNNYQLKAIILVDVCYKVWGTVHQFEPRPDGINTAHALQETTARRLKNGQTLRTPCLGWKEFTPSYFGPLREETSVDVSVNLIVPSLLHSVFDKPKMGERAPYFHQNVEVRDGILNYPERPYA
jgi:CRISPR-associated protein Cas5d